MRNDVVDTDVETMAVSPAEAARRLYVSKAHVYRMVSTGELKSARLGGRILIPVRELERLMAGAQ